MNEHTSDQLTRYRVVYCGTPEYAVPGLAGLATDERFTVELVLTQPDRPFGRKRVLTPPPVKQRAEELGIPVYQPEHLRTADRRNPVSEIDPDVVVVAAYGLIFGKRMLAIPRFGCVNLHASLLPAYRGASPVSASIIQGEMETGVTLMQMDEGIDTGAIISSSSIELTGSETTDFLTDQLARVGFDLLLKDLEAYLLGDLNPTAQGPDATETRMMTKLDGWIDWEASSESIERQVRAMWPWPRSWTSLNGTTIQVHASRVIDTPERYVPGSLNEFDGEAVVTCGVESLVLETVQPAGGKPVSGEAWLRGLREDSPVLGADQARPELPPLVRTVEADQGL